MINWQKVMKFCDQSWISTNFAPEFVKICTFYLNLEKYSISLESHPFPTFSPKCHECKI